MNIIFNNLQLESVLLKLQICIIKSDVHFTAQTKSQLPYNIRACALSTYEIVTKPI